MAGSYSKLIGEKSTRAGCAFTNRRHFTGGNCTRSGRFGWQLFRVSVLWSIFALSLAIFIGDLVITTCIASCGPESAGIFTFFANYHPHFVWHLGLWIIAALVVVSDLASRHRFRDTVRDSAQSLK